MSKKATNEKQTDEGPLKTAAKAVGSAAGKLAAMVGVSPEAGASEVHRQAAPKVEKFQKKHRERLPRKQKKAQQRAHGSKSAA